VTSLRLYLYPSSEGRVLLIVALVGVIALAKRAWPDMVDHVSYYVGLSAVLFVIGAPGVLVSAQSARNIHVHRESCSRSQPAFVDCGERPTVP